MQQHPAPRHPRGPKWLRLPANLEMGRADEKKRFSTKVTKKGVSRKVPRKIICRPGSACALILILCSIQNLSQNPKSKIRNPKSEIQNPKSEIQNLHKKNCYIRLQNPKSEIRNPKSEIQNPKSKIQNPKSEIQNPKSKIQNPKSKIQNPRPKSKIWGVGGLT